MPIDSRLNNVVRKLIAVDQFIGGLVGVIYAAIFAVQMVGLGRFLAITFLLLNAMTFFAGILLWRCSLSGFRLSALLHVIQIPFIRLHGFTYLFTAGFSLLVYISSDLYVWVRLNFGNQWMVFIGGTLPSWTLGIEVVAVISVVLLAWGWPRGRIEEPVGMNEQDAR